VNVCYPRYLHSLYCSWNLSKWLRHYDTSWKAVGYIPNEVIGFFQFDQSLQPHYGTGVYSASNRNEYQADNFTAIFAECLENVGASMSRNPMGLHGLLQGCAYFCFCFKSDLKSLQRCTKSFILEITQWSPLKVNRRFGCHVLSHWFLAWFIPNLDDWGDIFFSFLHGLIYQKAELFLNKYAPPTHLFQSSLFLYKLLHTQTSHQFGITLLSQICVVTDNFTS
jgi:hypothetical protein